MLEITKMCILVCHDAEDSSTVQQCSWFAVLCIIALPQNSLNWKKWRFFLSNQVILPSLRNLFIPVFLNCWLAKHALENMIVRNEAYLLSFLPEQLCQCVSTFITKLLFSSPSLSHFLLMPYFADCMSSDAESLLVNEFARALDDCFWIFIISTSTMVLCY